jgi:glycosyltransferase involved in cell wall biosynthesis
MGVELVSDPQQSLTVKALGRWWIPAVRIVVVPAIRRLCWNATAASYVTEETLQRRYPNRWGRQFNYSSVELPATLLEAGRIRTTRPYGGDAGFRLIFLGRLSWPLKGLDLLLRALGNPRLRAAPLHLDVLGGGTMLEDYRTMARQLGQESRVTFHDEQPTPEVHRRLLAADVMVLPSRREGLPRALIEAMACGLPCLATPVGGVAELLPPEYLLEPESPASIADKLADLFDRPDQLSGIGERNWRRVRSYESSELQRRREAFLATLFEGGAS